MRSPPLILASNVRHKQIVVKLTETQIKEIAELLECGHQCFVHKPTGRLEYHPDTTDYMFDPEPWQELLDKIESDWDNYEEVEKMGSSESFNVMRDFVYSLATGDSKMRLENALARPKPFRNFNYEIHQSEYREAWFKFRLESHINWVKKQF